MLWTLTRYDRLAACQMMFVKVLTVMLQVILSGGTSHTPKIAQLTRNIFPDRTEILAPASTTAAINPSELPARGAAIQASLIQEFDKDDIEQSTHPMVTSTPHLKKAIGIKVVSEEGHELHFKPLLYADSALPARRIAQYAAPEAGGDVLVRVFEGDREVRVTKPEPKEEKPAKTEEDEDDFSSDEDEEEEIRELVWKAEKPLAELAVKGVKAKGKVEVTIHVDPDLSVQITAREVDGKSAARGVLEGPKA